MKSESKRRLIRRGRVPRRKLVSKWGRQIIFIAGRCNEFPRLQLVQSNILQPLLWHMLPHSWIHTLNLRPYAKSPVFESIHWYLWLNRSKNTLLTYDDCNDHAIDAQNTSHNDWNERFHHYSRSPDWNTTDSSSGFGCSIGSSKILVIIKVLARTKARLTPINPKKAAPAFGG